MDERFSLPAGCRSGCGIPDGKAKVAKNKIKALDKANKSITFKATKGDILKEYKNIKIILQVTLKGKGILVHWILEYEKLNEDVPDPNSLLKFVLEVSKDINSHLCTQAMMKELCCIYPITVHTFLQ
ncbi:MLP-like protein 34 [Morella rubra]|uniref:MLP-like protein 34 n=1 Tax=Morella rubra TaxID=262757 RepID=A0A6A1V1L2_9ROSI|nr:MLP-like protein 34 [Morella rubra]